MTDDPQLTPGIPRDLTQTLITPRMATLERAVVDLAGQDWLPAKSLDRANPEEVEAFECMLDRHLTNDQGSFIYIGEQRFELVSLIEAELFRTERRNDFLRRRIEPPEVNLTGPVPKMENCLIFSNCSNPHLLNNITSALAVPEGGISFSKFANGETQVQIRDSVRDRDVFIIQSVGQPVNDHIIELALAADACKRASARSITAILPYYAYARQDCKGNVRGPISARWAADLYRVSGINRVVTIDIHARQIEGFFDTSFDNLTSFPLFIPYLTKHYGADQITLVSPDAGGMPRVEKAADILSRHLPAGSPEVRLAGMSKRRSGPNKIAAIRLNSDPDLIRESTCILVDDLIDTGASSISAAKVLREFGANKVIIQATHPILSWNAVELLRQTADQNCKRIVDEVLVTDTLPLRRARGDLITVISVGELLAEAIRRICHGRGESLRELSGFIGHNYEAC